MLKNILRPLDKNHRIFPLKGKVDADLFLPFRGRTEVGVGRKVKMALLILPFQGED
jgi:hypothetical protein